MLADRAVVTERPAVSDTAVPEVLLVGLLPVYRHGLEAGLQHAGLSCVAVPDASALAVLDGTTRLGRVAVVRVDQAPTTLPLLRGPVPRHAVLVVEEADAQAYADALRMGATGVVSTAMELEDAVAVIRCAALGQTLMPASVARSLCRPLSGPAPSLTGSERGWLRGLADGGTVSGLARMSGYSEREMYRLLSAVYARLGAASRTEALLLAERWGLLTEGGA